VPDPDVLVLRPLRAAAHKALAVPVGLLLVGIFTSSAVITLLTMMWTIFVLTGVLLSRVKLDQEGFSVRFGLRSRRVAWPDVQAIYIDRGLARRRAVLIETVEKVLRLPSPPSYFRSDEARLADQERLVDAWWRAHRGRKWKRAKRPSPRTDGPFTLRRR
jgi:hypothetical protein